MNRAERYGRVAVLFGGRSAERAISLDSGTAVLQALQRAGVDARAVDPGETDFAHFLAAGFDRVCNVLHGPGGEDGVLQGALEWSGIPYTGSGVLASAITMDKQRSKVLVRDAGFETPAAIEIAPRDDALAAAATIGYPLFVKPVSQGSSVGMQRVDSPATLARAVAAARDIEERVLLEAFVDGDEYTVAILGDEALPSIRIETPNVFYDYKAKYHADTTRYICPGIDGAADDALRDTALAIFRHLGCSGWGRVDFMTGADGLPQFIEVNTVPGMTSHSLVPMAANAVGLDFEALCLAILDSSMSERADGA